MRSNKTVRSLRSSTALVVLAAIFARGSDSVVDTVLKAA